MNVKESETEQNDGLSIQNRELPSDGDDSQSDARCQDEGQPSVNHSVSSIQNKTQQEKGIITKRLASKLMVVTNDSLFIVVPSNPGTVRDIPQPLSSSPVKRPNPNRVQFAGVEKRGSRNVGLRNSF